MSIKHDQARWQTNSRPLQRITMVDLLCADDVGDMGTGQWGGGGGVHYTTRQLD